MQRFVLDTSLFTNPDVYRAFGPDAQAAIRVFARLARATGAEFYMPGSVYEELGKIKDLSEVSAEFEAVVRIRSPRKHELTIPGALLYELIEEVRYRIDRGLRIAEEAAKEAAASSEDPGRLINRLRGRYREALRQGILDSKEDVDVLLLSFELEAALVCADEGLRKWADKVGIEIARPLNFRGILEHLARPTQAIPAATE
ncbi:MAG: RNA ligase partner protein [Chromatiaceae bacterium]|nr:RNA ligase partner protein [Chromatiaceae bacterium]